jgi:hypothetical protein
MARSLVYPHIGPGGAAIRVRLPKGARNLDARLARTIESTGQRLSTSKGCTVVFFKKGGKLVAAQRCEGRKLKAHNRRQCRGKKKRFVRCR